MRTPACFFDTLTAGSFISTALSTIIIVDVEVLYISTSIWILHTPNAGPNMLYTKRRKNEAKKCVFWVCIQSSWRVLFPEKNAESSKNYLFLKVLWVLQIVIAFHR